MHRLILMAVLAIVIPTIVNYFLLDPYLAHNLILPIDLTFFVFQLNFHNLGF